MDDDGDDKDDTKRRTRNLSEKKRRDQFNLLVTELANLITNNSRKMDKSSILKSTISFLRNYNEKTVRSRAHDVQEDWKPAFLSNEEFTYLVLEALEAFVMVFSASGRIYYASDSILSLLGHKPADLVNKSIYDITYEEDRPILYNMMQKKCAMEHRGHNSNKEKEIMRFQIHIRRGMANFKKDYSYDLVQFYGHFRSKHDQDEDAEPMNFESRVLFVCIGRLQTPLLVRDVSLVDTSRNEFTSRHSLEWKFLFLDHRAPPIIGYLPFEVLGTSGYDYYHFDDLEKVVSCHEELMEKGELTSCHYRFLTKGQQWIWLQSRFYITYHQWNSKPEFVVCTHRVVSYDDVVKTKIESLEYERNSETETNPNNMNDTASDDLMPMSPSYLSKSMGDSYSNSFQPISQKASKHSLSLDLWAVPPKTRKSEPIKSEQPKINLGTSAISLPKTVTPVNILPKIVTPVNMLPTAPVSSLSIAPVNSLIMNANPPKIFAMKVTQEMLEPMDVMPGNISPMIVTPRNLSPRNLSPMNVSPVNMSPMYLSPAISPVKNLSLMDLFTQDFLPRRTSPMLLTPKEMSPSNLSPTSNLSPRNLSPKNVSPLLLSPSDWSPRDRSLSETSRYSPANLSNFSSDMSSHMSAPNVSPLNVMSSPEYDVEREALMSMYSAVQAYDGSGNSFRLVSQNTFMTPLEDDGTISPLPVSEHSSVSGRSVPQNCVSRTQLLETPTLLDQLDTPSTSKNISRSPTQPKPLLPPSIYITEATGEQTWRSHPASVKSGASASSTTGTINTAATTGASWPRAHHRYHHDGGGTGTDTASLSGESRTSHRNSERESYEPTEPSLAPHCTIGAQYLDPSVFNTTLVDPPVMISTMPVQVSQDQAQIQEQLQKKHEELQQMIMRQQEELRRVKEQLLMARFGILQPIVNVQSPYPTQEDMQNQQRMSTQLEYANTPQPIAGYAHHVQLPPQPSHSTHATHPPSQSHGPQSTRPSHPPHPSHPTHPPHPPETHQRMPQ